MGLPAFEQLRKDFASKRVLLVGDSMVDAYIWGTSTRLSPEAPVPVIDVAKREQRPGGAANVAINLKALGADVLLITAIGADLAGNQLLEMMQQQQFDTKGFLRFSNRVTSVKTRIISNNKQVLRVDEETVSPVAPAQKLLATIFQQLKSAPWDVVLIQDYDKGVLTPDTIQTICNLAVEMGIPVVVDPKKKNFLTYKGVSLFKPNLKELEAGLGIQVNPQDIHQLEAALLQLKNQLNAHAVLVTLSEHGIAYLGNHFFVQPAYSRQIVDVSGAGDTVISVAALALASGYSPKQVANLANLAGGLVCEHPGVVPVTLEMLQKGILEDMKS
jgi:rfaE bifunctional protein kinase chain/domain